MLIRAASGVLSLSKCHSGMIVYFPFHKMILFLTTDV